MNKIKLWQSEKWFMNTSIPVHLYTSVLNIPVHLYTSHTNKRPYTSPPVYQSLRKTVYQSTCIPVTKNTSIPVAVVITLPPLDVCALRVVAPSSRCLWVVAPSSRCLWVVAPSSRCLWVVAPSSCCQRRVDHICPKPPWCNSRPQGPLPYCSGENTRPLGPSSHFLGNW